MTIRLLLSALVFFLTGTAGMAAEVTFRAAASPPCGDDSIPVGMPVTIDLYMNNVDDKVLSGYSMPLGFYSPDGSITDVEHHNVGGFSAVTTDFESFADSSIMMVNGFDGFWTMMNVWFGFGWDGHLPDTINHTTISTAGWPPGLGENLFIRFSFLFDDTGTICVDSVDHAENNYDWLFGPLGTDVPFNGPYCWKVVEAVFFCGDVNYDGTINIFDATWLIAFLYYGGPPPLPELSGDVDGSGQINLLDVVYLIDYIYYGGPAPGCFPE